MIIQISKGLGVGPTELSAFDQALVKAGVANFNLIYLSSVIPPESQVIEVERSSVNPGHWGDRLYVVMAQKRTVRRNMEVWAGIGWIQDEETGQGLLVEHVGHSEDEINADIENSLSGLAKNRGMKFGPVNRVVAGQKCGDQPVCALVVAAFETAPWKNNMEPKTGRFSRLGLHK